MLSLASTFRYRRSLQAAKSAVATAVLDLRQHTYTAYDLQYIFLFMIFTFCYAVVNKPVWFKLPIVLLSLASLIPRRTRAFMLPFLAVASWLTLFYSCRFIPSEWRPHIYTSVLPTLDDIIYGGDLSNLLASSTGPWKDLFAWIPYGVLHFVMPVVVAIWITIFAPAGTLPVFARTFGYMNLAGVLTQLIFPCAPPWYETRYGPLQPAVYSMPGDPGGLTRVDEILGTSMYGTTFTASPLVFGAFPSLHSGCAWQVAFFIVFTFGPRSMPFALLYVFWIWWAAMYLGHHYVTDLVGGGFYAIIAFWIGSTYLPPVLDPLTSEAMESYQCSEYTLVASKDTDKVQESNDAIANGISVDEVVVDISNTEVDSKATTFATLSVKDTISTGAYPQGWNGWIGYENWVVVLMSMKSGRYLPRNFVRISTGITQKSPLMNSPIESHADGLVGTHYSLDGAIDLETMNVDVKITANNGTGSSTSTVLSSPSSPLPSAIRDSTLLSNIAISADEDESNCSPRTIQLSVHNSSSMTAGSKRDFLEPEVGLASTTLTVMEASRDSALSLLTVGSNAPGMFVSSLGVPTGGSGKRFKDD
ncbi:hypothetical protein B0O80DRAFT_409190 [Mortierella sp. GBAus27b]|nr:Aureobasidin resistance protein Aur1 [Mortierella sp. GBA43]KAI8362016.1 hypothetical protein B0O80DRAFT_409190 [Mortierella sp. GBAus27b]